MKPWYVQKVHNPRDTVEETTIYIQVSETASYIPQKAESA